MEAIADGCIRVVVRLRPLLPEELQQGHELANIVVHSDQQHVLCSASSDGKKEKSFKFDRVMDESSSQGSMYADCRVGSMVDSVIAGYNATVFAYGLTGSGKTFTMEGNLGNDQTQGVAPRALRALFAGVNDAMRKNSNIEYTVEAKAMQIYNERIYDLLTIGSSLSDTAAAIGSGPGLKLRRHRRGHFFAEHQTTTPCSSAAEAIAVYKRAVANRISASHRMNQVSSRSHFIFTVHVRMQDQTSEDDGVHSELSLVDLAGSERVHQTGAKGARLKESIGINKSLFVLRKVIQALSGEKSGGSGAPRHVPYRDSKLTALLQHSFGGNSVTLMVACLSPSEAYIDETLSTLVYAARASRIQNKPTINVDPRQAAMVALQEEIARLKAELHQARMEISELRGALASADGTMPTISSSDGEAKAVRPIYDSGDGEGGGQGVSVVLKAELLRSVSTLKAVLSSQQAAERGHQEAVRRCDEATRENRILAAENADLRSRLDMLEYVIGSDLPPHIPSPADLQRLSRGDLIALVVNASRAQSAHTPRRHAEEQVRAASSGPSPGAQYSRQSLQQRLAALSGTARSEPKPLPAMGGGGLISSSSLPFIHLPPSGSVASSSSGGGGGSAQAASLLEAWRARKQR